MPRTERNWNRVGANFELDVMHYLAGCECESRHKDWDGFGYECLRSSGSRGKVDVVAVWGEIYGPALLFVQVKLTNPLIPPAERIALQDLALRANALPLVAYKTAGVARPYFRQLTGPGPKDWAPWEPGEDD